MVKLNGKWGVIDITGKQVIPAQYEDIQNQNNYDEANEYRGKLNGEWHYYDNKGELRQTTKAKVASVAKDPAQPTAMDAKILQPPVPMKGSVDPSIVGTWKYHDDAKSYGQNYSVFFIFRADGTYDNYQDHTGNTQPPPVTNNFWRIDGEYLEVLPVGAKAPARLKLSKRNDTQKNKPALVIQWNTGSDDYRTYYPVEKK
jgi:hypothetical protein